MKRDRVAHRTVMRHCGAPIRHRDHATPRNRGGPTHEPSETEFEGHAAFLASAESVRAAVVAALVAGRQECADHHWSSWLSAGPARLAWTSLDEQVGSVVPGDRCDAVAAHQRAADLLGRGVAAPGSGD